MGLDQDIGISVASTQKHPPLVNEIALENGKSYVNIRAVPEGVSKKLTDQLLDETNISSEPKLIFEYLNKDLAGQ